MIKNIEASIKSKLLALSKHSGINFNSILLQYFQERFLYRLSISEYNQNFVLKGALLFRVYNMPSSRPTTDIDFLGTNTSSDEENILRIVMKIINIKVNDGVKFDDRTISSKAIKEMDDYQGIRIYCIAQLGQAKMRIHFDIGFGDIIVPEPIKLDFPTLLDFQPSPKIIAYTPESAIAEKFEAIISLGIFTSRMKDFYDIYFMSKNHSFTSTLLNKAINATFENRSTDIPNQSKVFSDEYRSSSEKHKQWKAFLDRIGISNGIGFKECVEYIEKFISPTLANSPKLLKWNSAKTIWE